MSNGSYESGVVAIAYKEGSGTGMADLHTRDVKHHWVEKHVQTGLRNMCKKFKNLGSHTMGKIS